MDAHFFPPSLVEKALGEKINAQVGLKLEQLWLHFDPKLAQVGLKLEPFWLHFGSKLASSWAQVGPSWLEVGSKLAQVGLSWPSWPKLAPRAKKVLQKVVRWTPWGHQVGAQNGAKIDQKSIQNLMHFLIDF